MKVSVITVTLNALSDLRRTLASVVSQEGVDVEHIVVDGASSDGTLEYLKSVHGKGLRWISERDNGIYEAMNKGTRMASGDYCIYMNAGDCFVGPHVLSKVSAYLDGTDFILGNELRVSDKGKIIRVFPSTGCFNTKFLFQSSIRHQATIIRKEVALAFPYDESLRLVSDWKFVLERFLDGRHSFNNVDIDICFFLDGGATKQHIQLGQDERRKVLMQYPEYRCIWENQYKPSIVHRLICRSLLYIKRLLYQNRAKLLYM